MLFSLPGATKMFQFTPFASGIYFALASIIQPGSLPALLWVSSSLSLRTKQTQNRYRMTGLQPAGLPHSEIPGSKLAYSLPRLIAVRHVLHRHLVRRHPPYALCTFTNFLSVRILSVLLSHHTAESLYITV